MHFHTHMGTFLPMSVTSNRSAGGSRQHVAGDGCRCTGLKCDFAVIGQKCSSCCQTNIRCRIDITEKGNRPQNFIFCQPGKIFKRCSFNRHQCIDGNRVNPQFRQTDCHVQTILPGLSHTDDTARTGTHSFCFHFFQCFNLLVIGMSSADIREIPSGGFNVVMITGYTGFMETMQLLFIQESHRSTQINLTFLMHCLKRMNRFLKFRSGQGSAGCYDREAIHSLALIHLTGFHNFFFRQKIINFTIRVIVSRLCTIFTILRTAAAAAVDDRTQIHFISYKISPNTVSPFTKLFQITVQKE